MRLATAVLGNILYVHSDTEGWIGGIVTGQKMIDEFRRHSREIFEQVGSRITRKQRPFSPVLRAGRDGIVETIDIESVRTTAELGVVALAFHIAVGGICLHAFALKDIVAVCELPISQIMKTERERVDVQHSVEYSVPARSYPAASQAAVHDSVVTGPCVPMRLTSVRSSTSSLSGYSSYYMSSAKPQTYV